VYGIRSAASEAATSAALDFHEEIGREQILSRLKYLKNYWYERAVGITGVEFYTTRNNDKSCGLASIGFETVSPKDIAEKLLSDYRILVGVVECGSLSGIRVSPHIYTRIDELDKLLLGLNKILSG
jgi:selenocysteine lyase/cysteine desulfurase